MRSTAGSRSRTSPTIAPKVSSKKALDQLLAQLKIEPEGATAQAEIEPLIAMGEQVLGEGDAPRAASIFRQVRDMAPDNPEVIGGLVRALDRFGRDDGSSRDPRWPCAGARGEAGGGARAGGARGRIGPGRPTRTRSSNGSRRIPTIMKRGSSSLRQGWPAATATAAADALLEIVRRDREWNDGAARKRFLQLLEAQGLEDPWSSAQRRRLSAVLFT